MAIGSRRGSRLAAPREPARVAPVEARLEHARRRAGRELHGGGERIGLEQEVTIGREDLELVERAGRDARDEQLEDAGAARPAHRQATPVPGAEVADHGDALRARRPHREVHARDALLLARACAEHLPQAAMRALGEQVQVELAERRGEPIGILALEDRAIGEAKAQAIGEGRLRNRAGEQAREAARRERRVAAVREAAPRLRSHRAGARAARCAGRPRSRAGCRPSTRCGSRRRPSTSRVAASASPIRPGPTATLARVGRAQAPLRKASSASERAGTSTLASGRSSAPAVVSSSSKRPGFGIGGSRK